MLTKIAQTIEHIVAFGALVAFLTLIGANDVSAQSVWDQCTDGRSITRCETYDCPNGDTNSDGKCSLDDTGARLSDVRNDSFCSNPISGCGEVRYFAANDNDSCSVRVEEKGASCDLYQTGQPTFTPTPTPTPTPRATATPSPTVAGTTSSITCSALVVSPSNPVVGSKVNLETKVTGVLSNVEEYKFDITDKSGDKLATVVQPEDTFEQVFTKTGDYTVKATVITKDNKEVSSSSCTKEVTVVEKAIGGGATTKGGEELPETGSPLLIGSIFVLLGVSGIYMYDKYKFI